MSTKRLSRTRILIIAADFFPEVSGTSVMLYRHLKALEDRDDLEFRLLAPDYRIFEEMDASQLWEGRITKNATYVSYKSKRFSEDRAICQPLAFWNNDIEKKIEAFRPDLIHVEEPFRLFGLPVDGYLRRIGVRYAKAHNIAITCMIHTDYLGYAKCVSGRLINQVVVPIARRVLFPWVVNAYDRVICHDTDKSIRDLERNYVRRNKINPIKVGCIQEPERAGPDSTPSYNRIKREGRINFIYVGRTDPEKNVSFLVQAFRELLRGGDERAHLHIVGGGATLGELLEYKSDHIHFHGEVPPERVFECLRSSDIYVTASDKEVCSISALEAGYCGLPLVLVKGGGYFYYRDEQECGILCESNNKRQLVSAMQSLLSSSDLRLRYGTNARVEAMQYQVKLTSERLLSLWTGLIAGSQTVSKYA